MGSLLPSSTANSYSTSDSITHMMSVSNLNLLFRYDAVNRREE